eukprot:Stramenopile-MAST_4_protein_4511
MLDWLRPSWMEGAPWATATSPLHESTYTNVKRAPPPVMNDDVAPPPEGRSDERPATRPKPSHNEAQKEFRITASYYGSSARLEVPHHVWVGAT